jgi:hypothetical protein
MKLDIVIEKVENYCIEMLLKLFYNMIEKKVAINSGVSYAVNEV